VKPQVIYLVRHGEIDTGGKKRYIGHTDLPLSETGRAQAPACATNWPACCLAASFAAT